MLIEVNDFNPLYCKKPSCAFDLFQRIGFFCLMREVMLSRSAWELSPIIIPEQNFHQLILQIHPAF